MALSPKESARQLLDLLPDDVSHEEVAYSMYVRMKVERGLRDVEAGRGISHAEMKKEMAAWRESLGQRMQAETTETSSRA